MRYEITDDELGNRIQRAAKTRGLEATKLAARYAAERFVDRWSLAMGSAPTLLVGGLQFPQSLRTTTGADLRSVVRYSDDELLRGCQRFKEILRPEGVDLQDVRVCQFDESSREPMKRLQISVVVGGICAETHVDIASGFWGRDAWSRSWTANFRFGSTIPGGPTYTANVQCIEATLAERWIAVATQRPEDTKMMVLADLLFLHAKGVDMGKVGSEIIRILRHRNIAQNGFNVGIHRALVPTAFLERTAEWEQVRAGHRSMSACRLDQALVSLERLFRHGVSPALTRAQQRCDLALPRPVVEEGDRSMVSANASERTDAPALGNVIAFRRR